MKTIKLLKFFPTEDLCIGELDRYVESYEDSNGRKILEFYKAIEIQKGILSTKYYLPEEVYQVYEDLAEALNKEKYKPKGFWNKLKNLFSN